MMNEAYAATTVGLWWSNGNPEVTGPEFLFREAAV